MTHHDPTAAVYSPELTSASNPSQCRQLLLLSMRPTVFVQESATNAFFSSPPWRDSFIHLVVGMERLGRQHAPVVNGKGAGHPSALLSWPQASPKPLSFFRRWNDTTRPRSSYAVSKCRATHLEGPLSRSVFRVCQISLCTSGSRERV